MLHVFDSVCYLIDEHVEVLSLATPEAGNGPFSIVVPSLDWLHQPTMDEPIFPLPGGLQIGEYDIDTTRASAWEPKPPWQSIMPRADAMQRHFDQIREVLWGLAPRSSFASLVVPLPEPDSPAEVEMLDLAHASAARLLDGLRREDTSLFRYAATEMVGLGAGLTPDGDDFLTGLTLGLWAGFPHKKAEVYASIIAEKAAPRTSLLSRAWLRAAARGECEELWHALFTGLLSGARDRVRSAARAILNRGHTSGASALAGFLAIALLHQPTR